MRPLRTRLEAIRIDAVIDLLDAIGRHTHLRAQISLDVARHCDVPIDERAHPATVAQVPGVLAVQVENVPAVLAMHVHTRAGQARDRRTVDRRQVSGVHDRRIQPAQRVPQPQVARRVLARTLVQGEHRHVRIPDAVAEIGKV